jgi:hypothetical protein
LSDGIKAGSHSLIEVFKAFKKFEINRSIGLVLVKAEFFEAAQFKRREEGHDHFVFLRRLRHQASELREFSDRQSRLEIADLVGERDGLFLENRRALSSPYQRVLVTQGQLRDVHLTPDFFDRRLAIRTSEDVLAQLRQFGQVLAGATEALEHLKLADELFLRQGGILVAGVGGVRVLFLGQQRLALPVEQGGGHDQEVGGDIEVELLHQEHVGQVLVGDLADGNRRDIQLMRLNQVQEQVERTFEALQADRDG